LCHSFGHASKPARRMIRCNCVLRFTASLL